MAIGANNLLMLALSNYRRKLFDLQTFQNQAHIISVTGIIIYFLGTYYLYTLDQVASVAPELLMADYRVTYSKHKQLKEGKGERGSNVGIFTNMNLR